MIDCWAYARGVEIEFSRPRQAHRQCLGRKLQRTVWPGECLNTRWLLSQDDARRKIGEWRGFYNQMRSTPSWGG